MNFTEYQALAGRTAKPNQFHGMRCLVAALGLCGEAGEAGELVKKHQAHGHEDPEIEAKVGKEIGDVLWYAAELATCYGLDLGAIAEANIAKLRARYPEGFSTEASVARVDTVSAEEVRRAFTDPNLTTDERTQALADAFMPYRKPFTMSAEPPRDLGRFGCDGRYRTTDALPPGHPQKGSVYPS